MREVLSFLIDGGLLIVVLCKPASNSSKVTLLSGGGSGHEPVVSRPGLANKRPMQAMWE
jgi:hypothetical protein